MGFFKKYVFFFRGSTQALFFLALVLYVWFYPPSNVFEGTWADTLIDSVGVACLVVGVYPCRSIFRGSFRAIPAFR
jgi:hypothetical protein